MYRELNISESEGVLAAFNAVCKLKEETERLQAACAAKEAELAGLRAQTAELFAERVAAEGADADAVTAAKAMWQHDPESAARAVLDCDIAEAANPYGCQSVRGRVESPAQWAGFPVKKTDPTEEERKQKEEEERKRQEEQQLKEIEERKKELYSLNNRPFDNGRSGLAINSGIDVWDLTELLNKYGYRYGTQRNEKARAWEGYGVSRIYFGKDYITIKDGVITNRDSRKTRACTICDDAMNAIHAVLSSYSAESADRVYSARTDDASRRRSEPIEMPDGTKCYTEDCKKHEEKTRQTTNNNVEYAHDDNSRTGGRSEKERSGGALQRAGQASSHSEQGGDKEDGRQLGRRVLLPESVKRSVQKSLRALGVEDKDAEKRLTLTTTAQVQSVLDGRKPAFLEPFQELVEDIYSTVPHDENIRYVAGNVEYCIYNADSVRNVLSSSASGSELDSIVKGLIDDSKSGVILGYGYNFLDNPRGWNVSITANGEEISGFDAPPDITESEYYASERTEDFRRAFPDMDWSFRIKE